MKPILRIGRGVPTPPRWVAVSAFLLRCTLVLILAIAISLGQIIEL